MRRGRQTFSVGPDDDDVEPGPTPVRRKTRAQLRDFQGNLAVYVPGLVRFNADGYDPALRIKNRDDRGNTPRGVVDGWFWLNWLWRVNEPSDRARVYAAIKAAGDTHFQQNISVPDLGWQYHGLALVTQDDRDNYGRTVSTILDEADSLGLTVIGSGLTPGYPIAPGIDPSRIEIAMNYWDDTARLWDDLKACAASCPNALIFLELPGPRRDEATGEWICHPEPCGGDEPVVPEAGNGGAWLRACEQRFPNFAGVLHELNPDDAKHDENVAYLKACNRFWRDTQQVLFEGLLYQLFWQGLSPERNRAAMDAIRAECPQLKGEMVGCTPHDPPPDDAGGGEDRPVVGDEIPVDQITFVGPNIGNFARTASITGLELRTTGVHVEATKLDGPGRWIGRVLDAQSGDNFQYSMGLALKVNGKWYAAAPIECWHGQEQNGGPIQAQRVADADRPEFGQIAQNWFNHPQRWGALFGVQPKPGDEVGFFLCSGDARNGITAENERSNIVKFALPADGQTLTLVWR